MVAAARGLQGTGRHDRHAVEERQRQPFRLAGFGEAALAGGRIRAVVGGQPDPGSAHLAGHPHRLANRVALPDDQVAAARAERLAQVGQALREEALPVGGGADARVDHEKRYHPLGRGAGVVQRRVVPHAQVAGEEDDSGPHFRAAAPRAARPAYRAA
ncbi:hypothetical protein Pflav_039060 [Phytohabitans flavus]|uniref:Uncharacterized protein n=1 Tax=Phytohabitans flavus TaxID=1076124 RepID=A0A6F8XUJ0_9ACTN|nr:hypothetical protein Pflav_039060 [Phytohabitans flavus]